MPVRPPQWLLTYSVQIAPIHRGPDHYIAGVTIVATDDSAGPSMAVRAVTPDQTRALARALLHAATEAETRCWSTPGDADPGPEHRTHVESEPHTPTDGASGPPGPGLDPEPVERTSHRPGRATGTGRERAGVEGGRR